MDRLSIEELLELPDWVKTKIREIWNPQRGQMVCNLLVPHIPEMTIGWIISNNFDADHDLYFFVEYESGRQGGVWKKESLPVLTGNELNHLLINSSS